MRNRGFTCGTGGLHAGQGAQPYTRPATSHANPLFRARASSSAREPAIPSLGNTAHMRNSGLTCGTAGLPAEQRVYARDRGHSRTPDPLHHTRTRYSKPGPPHPHVNPLFRTRAISSAREPAIPSLGNTAHMRNSGSTCGTGCLRAEQQRAVPHGATRITCLHAAHRHCASASQVGSRVSGGHVLGEGDEVCRRFRVGGAHERRARKDEGRDGRQGAVTRLG